MMRNPRTIVTTVTLTLLVILVLQNVRATTLKFIIWEATVPVALVVLIAFFLGFASAWFLRKRKAKSHRETAIPDIHS